MKKIRSKSSAVRAVLCYAHKAAAGWGLSYPRRLRGRKVIEMFEGQRQRIKAKNFRAKKISKQEVV